MDIKTSDYTVYYFKPFTSNEINNTSGSDRYFTTAKYYEFTGININTVINYDGLLFICYAVIRTNNSKIEDLTNTKKYMDVKNLEILGYMKWKRPKHKNLKNKNQ